MLCSISIKSNLLIWSIEIVAVEVERTIEQNPRRCFENEKYDTTRAGLYSATLCVDA